MSHQHPNHTFPSATPASAAIPDVPLNLLNSFLPGFSVIRSFVIASSGFDITILVSVLFCCGAILGASSYAWRATSGWWMRFFSCSVTIDRQDALYDDTTEWISKHAATLHTRALTAKSRGSSWDELETFVLEASIPPTGQYFNFEDFDALVPPMYIPSAGSVHSFYHSGRYFQFIRIEEKSGPLVNNSQGRQQVSERIKLTCLGRSTEPLKQLLLEIKRSSKLDKARMTVIRHPSSPMRGAVWSTAIKRPSRPMNTIYLDEHVKTALLQDANEFLSPTSPKFYSRRGIPYRRGYLFHGLPGTGKTSLSFALAGVFGLKLHVLTLSEPTMTDQRLMQLFAQLPARCIVLLEDVDAAGLKRNLPSPNKSRDASKDSEATKTEAVLAEARKTLMDTKQTLVRNRQSTASGADGSDSTGGAGVTLSGLLNALDGVASQEGRLLVMTTNSPEDLDPALIRPGRVDVQVFFGNASKENARRIFERMFSPDADDDLVGNGDVNDKKNNMAGGTAATSTTSEKRDLEADGKAHAERVEMAERFAEIIPDLTFTPAEVQGYLLTRRKDPKKALEDAPKWRDDTIAAKSAGRNVVLPNA